MSKKQLHQKDQIITPLIEQGQSPYQILANHPELDMSVRSTTLFAASVAAALLMLQKLFKVLAGCTSPFGVECVSRLRTFGYSLLPVAVFASVGETLAVRFLSAGRDTAVSVQWGVLITFAVTMCLVTVFRYGVQLQKESDETL